MNAQIKSNIWEFINSKFLLFLLAILLAGNFMPKFLQSAEDNRRERQLVAEELRWQYQAREDMLLSLDSACCDILQVNTAP